MKQGALSLISSVSFFMLNYNMSSLLVFLKQLGFFLEQSWQHSFSISFSTNCVISFLRLTFFHTAFSICLYMYDVPRANILPKASRSSGSFLYVWCGRPIHFNRHINFCFILNNTLLCRVIHSFLIDPC